MTNHIHESLQSLAVPIASLHADPANARQHGQRNMDAIKASLAKFGQRAPLVVQRQGMVVRAGNGRLLAARELGWTEIAAVVVDEGDVEATAFAIADNRTAELASWDENVLASLLAQLQADEDFDHLLTGFSDAEISRLQPPVEGLEDPDDIPPVPDEPVARPGDRLGWRCTSECAVSCRASRGRGWTRSAAGWTTFCCVRTSALPPPA